ncbi:MAG: glycoside hydrolase family 16 protein [Candidatus Eremiobacteraeota bacterium]|nr:glycoside hydrolase family 16 protein [Candidatus Eremiobacteraeota bacterium]
MRTRIFALLLTIALSACGGYHRASTLPPEASFATGPLARTLVFDDEFSGGSLDAKTWYTCYPYAPPGYGCSNNPGMELEWYEAANVSVSGGALHLVAERHAVTEGGRTYPYTSGMISTGGTPAGRSTFAFLYGYVEARIKMPCGAGMWPAFWLVPANRTWPPEIDMMEYQGVQPTIDEVHIHWGKSSNPQQYGEGVDTHVNLCAGYHAYAVDWNASSVTWYFDGKPIARYADKTNVPHVPMYVILNLAIGGWVDGQMHPSPKSFPATMLVDWVRVYSET